MMCILYSPLLAYPILSDLKHYYFEVEQSADTNGWVIKLGLPQLPETAPTAADLVIGGGAGASTNMSKSTTSEAQTQTQGQGETEEVEVEEEIPSQTAKDLHRILLETCVREGKLVCGNCGHEYAVKEGVANFLLPGHLV